MRTIGLALALSALAACGRHEPSAQMAKPAHPALRLVALTDLSGTLEPCGCQSRPLGGIDKAAARVKALRAQGVPTLLVAAGDLLFGALPEGASSAQQAAQQERWKAETLVDIFNRLGLVAAAPGPRDLSYGLATLSALQSRARFAWLPAAPTQGKARERVAAWSGHVGAVPVGIVGISTFAGPESELPRDRLDRLRAAAQAEIDRLRKHGARVVLALVSSDQRTGRRLSGALHGLDFSVQGGLDQAQATPPSRAGDAVMLGAARQGQGLLVVDVYLDGQKRFTDVSAWTRDRQRQLLEQQIDDLSAKIAGWEHDPSVDRANLGQQRDRLSQLRSQARRLNQPLAPQGNAFDARFEPLDPAVQGDHEIAEVVDAYDARVNEHNRTAFADVLPEPVPPGGVGYVGSDRCKSCHEGAYAWWTHHPHGRAYTTLERVHKQFNFSCVGCHVTGYGKPGGATLVHNAGLTHVGCESCHGPGGLHVKQPQLARLTAAPGESTCKQCHTPEHSDLFDYTTYAARLRAPGHGLPPGPAQAPAASSAKATAKP